MEIFISDLDETLLNAEAKVSEYSKGILQNLIERGLCFTVASARTPLSALRILDKIPLPYPMILLNGGLIYNAADKKVIKSYPILEESLNQIIRAKSCYPKNYLFITEEENGLSVIFSREDTDVWDKLIDFSYLEKNDIYVNIEFACDEKELKNKSLLYALYESGSSLEMEALYGELKSDKNLYVDYYKDIYIQNQWYMEVFNAGASKKEALNWMKSKYRFDKWICFGNGVNDIPMFDICDEKMAVSNACPELKKIATKIIESNLDDGVAKYLVKRMEKKEQCNYE